MTEGTQARGFWGERWLPPARVRVLLAALPAGFAALGIYLTSIGDRPEGYDHHTMAWTTPSIVAMALTGAILLQLPQALPVAMAFLGGAFLGAIGLFAEGLRWASWRWDVASLLPIGSITDAVVGLSGTMALGLPVLVLPHVFPNGVLPMRIHRAIFRIGLAILLATFVAVVVASSTHEPLSGWAWVASIILLGLGCLVGLASLITRLRRGPKRFRKQVMTFGLVHFGLFFLYITVMIFVGDNHTYTDAVAGLLITLYSGGIIGLTLVGMARHQLYDARIVIRRALLYSIATVLVTASFVAMYLVTTAALSERLSSVGYQWAAMLGVVGMVLLVEQIRRRLLSRLESRVLGDRGRPIPAFDRLHEGTSTDNISLTYSAIVEALAAAVRAPGASLLLQDGEQLREVATAGNPSHEGLRFDALHRGELLGFIHVALRTPGEDYPEADRVLLQSLARQAAAQIYAVRRDTELVDTRREMLSAIEEERARLGRDLHDGLAPLLAGAGLSAAALSRDLPPGSQGAVEASRLAERMRQASGEVRRVAHGLSLGELTDPLEKAILTHLQALTGPGMPHFSSVVDVSLEPRLPAQAIYMVFLEAVNNAIRHASAKHIEISVRERSNSMTLQVRDDGCGIPTPYISGVGIGSMRKRIEALGGTFRIETDESGGTRVYAAIPVRV
jgi:signal transduction histidine kinase